MWHSSGRAQGKDDLAGNTRSTRAAARGRPTRECVDDQQRWGGGGGGGNEFAFPQGGDGMDEIVGGGR